jgi:hypothetical protein
MLVALGALPVLTYALVAYAVRPVAPVFGRVRLALVRAAVLVGSGAVFTVEVLGALHALRFWTVLVGWLAGLAVAAVAAWRRRGGLPGLARPPVVLAVLMLAELVVALAAPPNNWDSQTYHLPKIEHWVQQGTVDFFPTGIHRQVTLAPGAEYLLLHLRLLTGADTLDNLLQWSAGLGCALVASRIAGQLGGGRTAQLVSAFVVATAPMVVLESTSTQTDLVVAAWVGCVATLVLDELERHTPLVDAALIGAATGLTALTKATGLVGVAPLLAFWAFRQWSRLLTAGAVVALVAVALAGPYLYRVDQAFGSPIGPPYLRDLVGMQRHDPASVLVNALRIGQTVLDTPGDAVETRAVSGAAHLLGVDPSDREITFFDATYPVSTWKPDEDLASFPVQAALVLVAGVVLVIRGGVRRYAGAFWVAVLLYVTTVKWQPWGNRLTLFLLVLGAPLAALWLGPVVERIRVRRVAGWTAVVALAVGGCAGFLAVGYGWPRRLVGTGSVFTESRTAQRFHRQPRLAGDYTWAASALQAAHVHRVGLIQGPDSWEYPWWVLLPGVRIDALQSVVPGHPPVSSRDVDAIVCTVPCSAPPGWDLRTRGTVGYALRP